MEENFPLMDHFIKCDVIELGGAAAETAEQRHREILDAPSRKKGQHEALRSHTNAQKSHRSRKQQGEPVQQHHHEHHGDEHITGQLHHQHGVHFNADPNTEEGLTKLSWELVGGVLLLFFAVLLLWLRFALSPSKKNRKTS